jgi:hypothetical protein
MIDTEVIAIITGDLIRISTIDFIEPPPSGQEGCLRNQGRRIAQDDQP